MLTNIAITTSALLLNASLIWPQTFYWVMFLYLVPLFYVALYKKTTFKQGLLWGIVAYGIHFYYLFFLVHQRAQGSLRYIAVVFLIIYFGLYSGVWFYFMRQFSRYKYFAVPVFTFIYLYFIFNYSLFIFGNCYGYVFTCNLLPLVNTHLISLLPVFGLWVLTAFIICFSLSLAYFFHTKSIKALLFSFVFLIPFFFGPFKTVKTPGLFDKIGYVIPCCAINKTAFDIAQEIKYKIIDLVKNSPQIKIVVTPESTFPFELNNCSEVINWWFCDLQNKDIHILLSAHRRDDKKLYNTIYHLHKGKVVNSYDKKQLVPFCEYVPDFWEKAKGLISFGGECFTSSQKEGYFDIDSVLIKPYICSDIFLGELDISSIPIFLFMNESWFTSPYIKELLYLYIKLKSIESNKDILVIAHEKFDLV